MGQGQSDAHILDVSEEGKHASAKFNVDEIHLLRETFKDLAHRSNGDSIDKETFLQYIPLPGLCGERLFKVFDRRDAGCLHFDEFICGLATVCRGNYDEKIRFLFLMYDVAGDGSVSKAEMNTLLNHVPRSVFRHAVDIIEESPHNNDDAVSDGAASSEGYNESYTTSAEEELDLMTNHDVVELAFAECDLNQDGRLTYEQFKMWVERTPQMTEYLESMLPFSSSKEKPLVLERQKSESKRTLPFSRSSQSLTSLGNAPINNRLSVNGASFDEHTATAHSPDDPEETTRRLLQQAMEATHIPAVREGIARVLETLAHCGNLPTPRPTVERSGQLWKMGKALHMWHQRFYVLVGNCMYYYAHESDTRPKGVIFLTGSLVEALKHDEEHESKGWYGFEIENAAHAEQRRVLYTRSASERDEWVRLLQHGAEVVPIEEEYVIGKELGRGRFSVVCDCVHKISGKHYAVKIIDKESIENEEKELLRTEIAVLKLVHHPHIIRLQAVFESRSHLYIVMEQLHGGELFERIVGRPRFSEAEAAKVVRPLMEAVAYLHDLGIVHRDIKPENILCGDDLSDLKIADFGLSKLLLPRETMRMPCGTLSYVAPEVLTMSGYGKEADMWSIGVIMFLLLCGRLPFDGATREELIANTIRGEIYIRHPEVWAALSDDARDLVLGLLNKDPARRYCARQTLRHPWLTKFPYHHHHHHHHHHHSHHSQASMNGLRTPRGTGARRSISPENGDNGVTETKPGESTPRSSTPTPLGSPR